MPRIYDGNSDPHDFCLRHFPQTEEKARKRFGAGEGPDNRGNCFGYNAEHPPYSDTDYGCEMCGKRLTDNDN
jgi:hypothetical protein